MMSAGTVSVGGVLSSTVTVKVAWATLPLVSVAVQVTAVVPRGNTLPDAGVHTTTGADGAVSAGQLEPGTWRAVFRKPGYVERTVTCEVSAEQRRDVPVVLTAPGMLLDWVETEGAHKVTPLEGVPTSARLDAAIREALGEAGDPPGVATPR